MNQAIKGAEWSQPRLFTVHS